MAYDAILIPGGGVRSGGALPEWVVARFDRALERAGDALLIALSAGTPHRPPPLDERGFPVTEARAGAEYLARRGVAQARILLEESSYDTIGNAYFSRVVHAIPRGLTRLLVITSEFHMPRTEAVFRWVYALPGPGPACSLDFESVPNLGIEGAALAARIEKERASLANFEQERAGIGTLAQFHEWLFEEHDLYRAAPRPARRPIDVSTY
jgi:uncharacterized SAM-binding protein YcdF (DUF218 family)